MRKALSGGFAIAAMVGAVAVSSPANAAASAWTCNPPLSQTFIGQVNDARGLTTENGQCGLLGVAVGYRAYAGSPIYVTGTVWDETYARKDLNNIIVYADHAARSGAIWGRVYK